MDTRSDDRTLSDSGQTLIGSGEEADTASLIPHDLEADDLYRPREGEIDDAGCFTEAYFKRVLPPIPQWMREPPRPKERTLFD